MYNSIFFLPLFIYPLLMSQVFIEYLPGPECVV